MNCEVPAFELIAVGLSQAEIADKLGIAPSTVKSHLLRLFAKTGCHCQSDLLKLAAELSAPVRSASSDVPLKRHGHANRHESASLHQTVDDAVPGACGVRSSKRTVSRKCV